MYRRASKIAGLLASIAALLLAAGLVPAAADPPSDIENVKPRENAEPHRAPDEVVVTFSDEAPEDTSIQVKACDRTVSRNKTVISGDEASVGLKERPRGRFRVTVSYTADPEPTPTDTPSPDGSPSPDPSETPPPDEKPEKWSYSFKAHAGPGCAGSNGDKEYSWGSTTDPGHHGGHHAASASNPITAGSTKSHSGHTTGAVSSPSSAPSYTPFYSGRGSTSDHTTHSAIPSFNSDFGDSAFESSTEDTQLSDPTDPSLATPEPEVIAPEEADDERSLSAAPTDSLEPESGILLVALAAALLLGAGGGLFLRKADPAPARK